MSRMGYENACCGFCATLISSLHILEYVEKSINKIKPLKYSKQSIESTCIKHWNLKYNYTSMPILYSEGKFAQTDFACISLLFPLGFSVDRKKKHGTITLKRFWGSFATQTMDRVEYAPINLPISSPSWISQWFLLWGVTSYPREIYNFTKRNIIKQ